MLKEALIVIDVQNDLCVGGTLAIMEEDSVFPAINRLIDHHRHIILTQDWHTPDHVSFASNHAGKVPYNTITMPYGEQILWPDHCVMNTNGAAFHPGLNTAPAGLILRKGCNSGIGSHSAFFESDRSTQTGLAGYLKERGMERLIFCGLATDFCVACSAIDAIFCGFQARVVLDACRAIDLEGSFDKALKKMQKNGIELTLSA